MRKSVNGNGDSDGNGDGNGNGNGKCGVWSVERPIAKFAILSMRQPLLPVETEPTK